MVVFPPRLLCRKIVPVLFSLNKSIWIDCNNKISKVYFIKSKKIEDVTHNFSYVSLLN